MTLIATNVEDPWQSALIEEQIFSKNKFDEETLFVVIIQKRSKKHDQQHVDVKNWLIGTAPPGLRQVHHHVVVAP